MTIWFLLLVAIDDKNMFYKIVSIITVNDCLTIKDFNYLNTKILDDISFFGDSEFGLLVAIVHKSNF